MHVMVLVAALAYTKGVMQAFDFSHEQEIWCDLN